MIIRNFSNIRLYCSSRFKSYYVTTPIFYVNACKFIRHQHSTIHNSLKSVPLSFAAPHIGHLYSAVIADAAARFNGLLGSSKHIVFATGTDEHGIKIQQAAASQKIPVKSYCDKISKEYKLLFDKFGVNYTNFIRTTDESHTKAVEAFWVATFYVVSV